MPADQWGIILATAVYQHLRANPKAWVPDTVDDGYGGRDLQGWIAVKNKELRRSEKPMNYFYGHNHCMMLTVKALGFASLEDMVHWSSRQPTVETVLHRIEDQLRIYA